MYSIVRHLGFVWGLLGPPAKSTCLYNCANLVTIDAVVSTSWYSFNIWHVWPENAYLRHKIGIFGIFGRFDPSMESNINEYPKMHVVDMSPFRLSHRA